MIKIKTKGLKPTRRVLAKNASSGYEVNTRSIKFKFKFKSTGEGKPVACGPGAVSHSSAFLHKRNNIKPCIQTFGMLYQKQGEKR